MFKNYDKRGSVLLLVVGLLVILGTLGGTFLLVSSLDARQSKLLAGRGKAELIASGGVGKVVRVLGEDLHFAPGKASAPYTAPNITGKNAYKYYIDHTSVDKWLHGAAHNSDVFGTKGSLVSTESDKSNASADAYLIATGEFSDDGQEYYIAVKVVDLSSLLSLNTGGKDYIKEKEARGTDTSKILKTPALVKLKDWMEAIRRNIYKGIHKARCGGTTKDITVYDAQCGRRLLSPEPSQKYRPFAIAGEVYLRWLGSGNKANFGRVFDHLSSNIIGTDITNRRMLTTINSARSLMRSPIAGVIASRVDLSKADALNSDGKDGLYTQIVLIGGSDDGTGGGPVPGTELAVDNSGSGFYISKRRWKPTGNVNNAYDGECLRNNTADDRAWWAFDDLPQATYRVWASWGSAPNKFPAASVVPYMVYTGGTIDVSSSGSIANYSGGALKGTYVADQTRLPSDANVGGQRWQSLGSHSASGKLVVEIYGPQGVPEGETHYAFADAIRIEGIALDLGSGSQPAAHLTANVWAAMSEYEPDKAFAFKPKGKDWTVFGVQEQPFITEAFATHTTRILNPDNTYVENSWKWGAAIELMNFSSRDINLKDYGLVFGSSLKNDTTVHMLSGTIPKATKTTGGSLVLYDFKTGKGDTDPKTVFRTSGANWKRFEKLNFDGGTIRLVRIAKDDGKTYKIPLDHVVATKEDKGDLQYDQRTDLVKTSIEEPGQTFSSNCRRDDSVTRHRYAVAKYWKKGPTKGPLSATSHRLGVGNRVTVSGPQRIPHSTLKEGFRIKLRHGLLSGPGELSDLYLAGPILYDDASSKPADLPELLAEEFATEESRGRANSHAKNPEFLDTGQWKTYPRKRGGTQLAWPLLLGEIIETVPMDVGRGDSPTRVYGRINVNTASHEVLQQLPWPEGVNTSAAAAKIIGYRKRLNGFVTPGEVTLALDGLVGKDAAGEPLDRDGIYAAISSCITVNSDMYAVTVRVQLGDKTSPDRSWYYLAVIDRGCAVFSTDKPAVLLFTQLK